MVNDANLRVMHALGSSYTSCLGYSCISESVRRWKTGVYLSYRLAPLIYKERNDWTSVDIDQMYGCSVITLKARIKRITMIMLMLHGSYRYKLF